MTFHLEHSGTLDDVRNAVDGSDIGEGEFGDAVKDAAVHLAEKLNADTVSVQADGHQGEGAAPFATLTVRALSYATPNTVTPTDQEAAPAG